MTLFDLYDETTGPTERPRKTAADLETGWRLPPSPDRERGPEVAIFEGDVGEAPAEALCTSTNPRLSMLGGTGSAVVEAGGWSIRREAERILEAERERTGRDGLEAGTVVATSPGRLPHRTVFHCVASDEAHRSSPEIVRRCVQGALAGAQEAGCSTVAMPIFAAGHVGFPFDEAVRAILAASRDAESRQERIVLVVDRRERAARLRELLDEELGARG